MIDNSKSGTATMTEGAGSASDIQQLAIDTIKVLAMDAVQAAKSGHPGTPMALAPVAYAMWTKHLRHNPQNPAWIDRDRFVLSAGHASMLLYGLLYLTGYDLSLEDIRSFRQWGSKTPGHPEYGHTAGVETTTGPLGQGIANTVGMALAERWLAARFNRPGHEVIDHHTYALCSDGDLMEGLSHEAAEIAGHQQLGKLLWIFDDNRITIEGSTDLATSTDQATRFAGYGWHTQTVEDGTNLNAINAAIDRAKNETGRPSLIVLRTRIAEGSPNMVGQAATHGAPLGAAEIAATKENIGYPSNEDFHVETAAVEHWREGKDRWSAEEREWNERLAAYKAEYPALADELVSISEGALPEGWDRDLPDLADSGANATRGHSGSILQAVAEALPWLVGGSADLGSSNKTDIDGGGDLLPETPSGRVIHFGVREHAMGSILNGMALHGGVRPFGGTFLIFSDYMRPAIRLASLMGLPVTYVFTHDSIGLGEDGPTHQPVEQLMTLRAIPGLMDLRPADGPETVEAWRASINYREGPSFLALTRQKVPVLDRTGLMAGAVGLHRGGYVLLDAAGNRPDCILIASGSEISLALEAKERLEAEGVGVRVVSMPSWHLFKAQTPGYRDEVLPPGVTNRVSIEAGSTFGWSEWIGPDGTAIGIDEFGASAPSEELYARYGITVERVCEAARRRLKVTAAAS